MRGGGLCPFGYSFAFGSALAFNSPLLADYTHTPTLTKEAETLAYAALVMFEPLQKAKHLCAFLQIP